jgi:acetyltransferase
MTIRIRPLSPADAKALERFYVDLSEDSRHLRFFDCSRGIGHTQSVSFCTPDHEHREGFVAVTPRDGDDRPRIVGHLCLEPVDETTAEVAIAVADAYQHQGIGRRLMLAGIEWARSVGIVHLRATMLATNGPIQRLVSSLGLHSGTTSDDCGITTLTMDLTQRIPTAA